MPPSLSETYVLKLNLTLFQFQSCPIFGDSSKILVLDFYFELMKEP